MSRVLGIFAKQPIAGRVKTRLAAATSPEWAAQFAETLLHVTLDAFANLGDRRVLAFTPASGETYFHKLVGGRYEIIPQGDGDFGARMARFFTRQLHEPGTRVVLIGADSPTLPAAHVAQAFGRLQDHDVVLGPATDGGYCLIGCTGQAPPIFDGIAWSGPNVLRDTIRLLPAPARLALLPPWYDIDTLEDCRLLRGHLSALKRAGMELDAGHQLLINHLTVCPWLTD
jgi:rSAM/selenodomain-associated transferase 1